MQCGSICSLIAFAYFTYIIFKKSAKNDKVNKTIKVYIEALSKVIFAILICYSIYLLFGYVKSEDRQNNLMHFNNILVDKEFEARIDEMGKFIEAKRSIGKEVYILDVMSAMYTVPQDLYYKNYDMFNMGNFGKDGVSRYNRRYKGKRR